MITSFYRMLLKTRGSIENKTGIKLHNLNNFPKDPNELEISGLFNQWWYYPIELMPNIVTKGIYPSSVPFLPRIMLRKCKLNGMSCLDLGSMEGLIPILMCRGGASSVLATDAIDHCAEKMAAVKHYYNTDFEFRSVGLMYGLNDTLNEFSFDLINCSGLLYHVFSPLMVLSGIRPLLKRNGIMIVSTNVIFADSYTMEFNNAGRMQSETNTFWYISIKLFDYILRYLKLAPLDCLYLPHSAIKSDIRYNFNRPSGYLSVLCRAHDDVLDTRDDRWMTKSAKSSWEYCGLSDWKLVRSLPTSKIKYDIDKKYFRDDIECIDLHEAVTQGKTILSAEQESDSHVLRLSDIS